MQLHTYAKNSSCLNETKLSAQWLKFEVPETSVAKDLSVLTVEYHAFQWYLIYSTKDILEDKSRSNEKLLSFVVV